MSVPPAPWAVAAAMVERSDRPTADPTCWLVLKIAAADPCWLGSTPEVAPTDVAGKARPIPNAVRRSPGKTFTPVCSLRR